MEDLERIKKIMDEAKVVCPKDLDEEYKLESIQLVTIVALLEEEYDIEIDDDLLEVNEFNTLNKICNLIKLLK